MIRNLPKKEPVFFVLEKNPLNRAELENNSPEGDL